MDAPAAFKGTFADIRFLKGRRVCQVVIETPLEEASRIVEAFGAPNPAEEVWIGFARLNGPGVAAQTERVGETSGLTGVTPGPHKQGRSPAVQQAALVCKEPEFWSFARSRCGWPGVHGPEDAAAFVREYCRVASRRDITPGSRAEQAWNRLFLDYGGWRARQKQIS